MRFYGFKPSENIVRTMSQHDAVRTLLTNSTVSSFRFVCNYKYCYVFTRLLFLTGIACIAADHGDLTVTPSMRMLCFIAVYFSCVHNTLLVWLCKSKINPSGLSLQDRVKSLSDRPKRLAISRCKYLYNLICNFSHWFSLLILIFMHLW